MKEKEIELESFGLENLQPVGTIENPLTWLTLEFGAGANANWRNEVGIIYPQPCVLAKGLLIQDAGGERISFGPYAVAPEEVTFYVKWEEGLYSPKVPLISFSTDPDHCRIKRLTTNTFQYIWENGKNSDWNDCIFTVTFGGAQGP